MMTYFVENESLLATTFLFKVTLAQMTTLHNKFAVLSITTIVNVEHVETDLSSAGLLPLPLPRGRLEIVLGLRPLSRKGKFYRP